MFKTLVRESQCYAIVKSLFLEALFSEVTLSPWIIQLLFYRVLKKQNYDLHIQESKLLVSG